MSLPFEPVQPEKRPYHSGILNHLIELGTYGHFPLFDTEWINRGQNLVLENAPTVSKMSQLEKKLKKIYKKLSVHKSLERQKLALLNLTPDEQSEFKDLFLKMVEARLLTRSLTLH